ncbi:MAG: helix-turn-helix transcriptional regulator, partial [Candidatus Bathyarchaeia archaeon]
LIEITVPPEEAPTPTPTPSAEVYLLPILGFFLVLLVVVYLKRPRAVVKIDVDRILDRHPDLRRSDREVVRFIAERGGEVLESEIRSKFDLPKTTVWRLVKRLEENGIVRVKKFGKQNYVQLKST